MFALDSFLIDHILSSLNSTVMQCRNQSIRLNTWITEGNSRICSFEKGSLESIAITTITEGNSILLTIDAKARIMSNTVPTAFMPERAITLPLGPDVPDAILGSAHYGTYWTQPTFPASYAELRPRTQGMLLRFGEQHLHLLPLCGDNFRCEFSAGQMEITSDAAGLIHLKGPFLSVTVSNDPTDAIEKNYAFARSAGGLKVALRKERTFPTVFEKLGWCTWDAFYRDVSADKILAKLAECKEKQIPVKWVMIDNGWFVARDRRISAFATDPVKFPEGLNGLIRRMKEEYGVEHVGVWHTINGYWNGVDMESELYAAQRDNLTTTPIGLAIPAIEEDRAFAFWDGFYAYLSSEGVDFVKVDDQSSVSGYLYSLLPTAAGCRIAHAALERAVYQYFGGTIINCMGMDMENVLARPTSAIARNSDDFYPKVERGFVRHLMHNAYNALWHGEIYYCDFDMWWSDHPESAIQNGVLRAISGSPIYISDRIDESNRETILPTVMNDGTLMRCEQACRPTTDCIYTDCPTANKLLKVWNHAGENYAVAAFNVGTGDRTGTLSLRDIPGLPAGEYVAREYFSGTTTRMTLDDVIPISLPQDGVAVWSIYPVRYDGEGAYAFMGDTTKYVPIAKADMCVRL